MLKEFIITADGSATIFLPELDEHYHSVHGAIQESMHVYIDAGLKSVNKTGISILEVGFGTGLNAYLTFVAARQKGLKVNYFSIEKYPLIQSEYSKLNYPQLVFTEHREVFKTMHGAEWNIPVEITPEFSLEKINTDLLEYTFHETAKFDLIYYDAFAPSKQPELWTNEVLAKVAATLTVDGIFVTYCAKGTVRRALASSGLKMMRIPGPAGKKEMLKGIKEDLDIR